MHTYLPARHTNTHNTTQHKNGLSRALSHTYTHLWRKSTNFVTAALTSAVATCIVTICSPSEPVTDLTGEDTAKLGERTWLVWLTSKIVKISNSKLQKEINFLEGMFPELHNLISFSWITYDA